MTAPVPHQRPTPPQELRHELQSMHGRLLHEAADAAVEATVGDSHHRDGARMREALCIEHAAVIADLLWGAA